MAELSDHLASLLGHRGVVHLLLLDSDGLLIRHEGPGGLEGESVAAMTPELMAAAGGLGRSWSRGDAATVVAQHADGVSLTTRLEDGLLLLVLLEAGVGFAELLADVRARRERIAALV